MRATFHFFVVVIDQESQVMPVYIIEPDVPKVKQALESFKREVPSGARDDPPNDTVVETFEIDG